jgi:hypothetical protein
VTTVEDSNRRDIWGPAVSELLTSLLLADVQLVPPPILVLDRDSLAPGWGRSRRANSRLVLVTDQAPVELVTQRRSGAHR